MLKAGKNKMNWNMFLMFYFRINQLQKMPTTTNHYTQALTKSSGSKCVGHWPLVGHRTNLILKWFSLFVPKNIYNIIVLFKKESSFNTHSINTINAVKPSGSIMQFHMIPWGCLELTYPPQVIGVHIRWVLFFLIVFETFVFWLCSECHTVRMNHYTYWSMMTKANIT